jgi:Helix-turn-helix domain
MNGIGASANLVRVPEANLPAICDQRHSLGPKRLLDVDDVAKWLGVSKGWVRDHAAGRRQPRLCAIKLGPSKGKGLWKFREEDVYAFVEAQRRK